MFKSPLGIGDFFENDQKSPKKRNDLTFRNDLWCNDLWVSTVQQMCSKIDRKYHGNGRTLTLFSTTTILKIDCSIH